MTTDVLYQLKINGNIHETDKPAISGKDLLSLAGKEPPGDHVIYLLLEDGDMESIRAADVAY